MRQCVYVEYQECIMSQNTYSLYAPDSTYVCAVFVVFEGFHA